MAIRLSTGAKNAILDGDNDLRALMASGTVTYYTGTRPASADSPTTSYTKLVTFTALSWNAAADGAMALSASVEANAVATGTVGWFRLTTNGGDPDADDTSSKTEIRFDGVVSTSGNGEMNLNSASIVTSEAQRISTLTISVT